MQNKPEHSLSREQAQKKVERKINESDPYWPDKPKIVVLEESTIEKEWGWIFFYQSSEYLETNNFSSRLVGNGPYLVNKLSGELVETGTAHPIEYYINEYEKQMNTNFDKQPALKHSFTIPVSLDTPDENTIIPMGWILLWIMVIAVAGLLIWIIL